MTRSRTNIQREVDNVTAVEINKQAPDFELDDFDGKPVRLSDFAGRKHVVLVFNRGFS